MNAIIVSALLGVVMMFSGILLENKSLLKHIATGGLLLLLVANLMQTYGVYTVVVNSHELLRFQKFGLFFNTIAIAATLIYVVLSGKDIEQAGNYPAEYFALIFFVLCGVSILCGFNSLLMLFIGIEILSIPLYILTGSDKRNLKSNEASLKYFLMGAFTAGIMLMGIALIYGATGSFGIISPSIVTTPAGGATVPRASFLEIAGVLLLFVAMCFKYLQRPSIFGRQMCTTERQVCLLPSWLQL